MHKTLRVAVVSVAAAMLASLPATTAVAAPTDAPNMLSGTADCGSDGMFTFVVNTGRSEANTWSPAFVTRTDGATALFIPSSLDLTFTFPGGSDSSTTAKHTAPGPVSCEISASPFPGASLTGTVTGRLVWRG
jgi:hypothetical protein